MNDALQKSSFKCQKKFQLNYMFKRWQMFKMMEHILKKKEPEISTEIDHKMLTLAEKFVNEEYLILDYSHNKNIPVLLARDQMHIAEKQSLEFKIKDMQTEQDKDKYIIEEFEQNFAVYQTEISCLATTNSKH